MFLFSAVSLLVPAFTSVHTVRLLSFFVFEVCVGLFWPSLGFLRSKYVPADCRSTTMNLFRIPLNCIVVLVLANIGQLSNFQVFLMCFLVLVPAIVCQFMLLRIVEAEQITAGDNSTSKASNEAGAYQPVVGAEEIELLTS